MKITISRCHEDCTNQGNVEAFLTRADTGQTYTVHVYAMTQVRIVNRVHLVALSHHSCLYLHSCLFIMSRRNNLL